MSTEDAIKRTLERTTSDALAYPRVRAILSGGMAREDLRDFFHNFIVTHLNSVQILSFLFAVAPRAVHAYAYPEPAGAPEAEQSKAKSSDPS